MPKLGTYGSVRGVPGNRHPYRDRRQARHQFPNVGILVKKLRDTPCGDPSCAWCSNRHDGTCELNRWFPDIKELRPTPADAQGVPLQRAIVAKTLGKLLGAIVASAARAFNSIPSWAEVVSISFSGTLVFSLPGCDAVGACYFAIEGAIDSMSMNGVSEPETSTLLLGGLSILVFIGHRRKRQSAELQQAKK